MASLSSVAVTATPKTESEFRKYSTTFLPAEKVMEPNSLCLRPVLTKTRFSSDLYLGACLASSNKENIYIALIRAHLNSTELQFLFFCVWLIQPFFFTLLLCWISELQRFLSEKYPIGGSFWSKVSGLPRSVVPDKRRHEGGVGPLHTDLARMHRQEVGFRRAKDSCSHYKNRSSQRYIPDDLPP